MVLATRRAPATEHYDIPFNKPSLVGTELQYLTEAVMSGWVSGDGQFSKQCQALLERDLGVRRAFLTPSGTQALEMAALLLDVGPGDEIILPSFTFVSTANAFVLRGATPVFADIRPDTLNINEEQVASLITERTKAVVPVHYAGIGCEMDAICAAAAQRNIAVVEDAAHALFGKYRQRMLGTFGAMAVLSFHETKNFTCGEGGALLINDEQYLERAEVLREKGTDRARFFRGETDHYTWVDIGSSYVMSDVLAAFLYAQLEAKARILDQRRRIFLFYQEHLAAWADAHGVRLPIIPGDCEPNYHMYYLVLPSNTQRNALIKHLKRRGILSVFHFVPLHASPMGRRWKYKAGDCPVSEAMSECLVRLPFYNTLSDAEQLRVVEAIREAPMGAS